MVCYKVDGATGCCLIRKGVRPINSLSPFLADSIMQDHFIGMLCCGKNIHDFDDLSNGRRKKITCFTFAAVEEVCEVPIQLVPDRGAGQAADEIHTVSRFLSMFFHCLIISCSVGDSGMVATTNNPDISK